eukprot:CAMPEP_0197595318 /NCGR_PEP_ID=MMETSP1326-20131121/22578_1 /TAXON_ID=1155430 /ORGANISM="Genus nov. species nov., Strain RCC2288" /LENGTH=45 /DNA_ID= /DNA_START= /DNA_END= /DNA_ORIENTATION=
MAARETPHLHQTRRAVSDRMENVRVLNTNESPHRVRDDIDLCMRW